MRSVASNLIVAIMLTICASSVDSFGVGEPSLVSTNLNTIKTHSKKPCRALKAEETLVDNRDEVVEIN
jgi:hypothetical protein